jgi:hypothetical protein
MNIGQLSRKSFTGEVYLCALVILNSADCHPNPDPQVSLEYPCLARAYTYFSPNFFLLMKNDKQRITYFNYVCFMFIVLMTSFHKLKDKRVTESFCHLESPFYHSIFIVYYLTFFAAAF